ncbi:Mismatch repair endonuclease pms2 [Irineochytrium annulatum]|nr:Mismatch repair endonuclease pms2 [Irineochytrium annulatum]
MIKSIDRTSVHRITSGQVVIDLATAVKVQTRSHEAEPAKLIHQELVENSLDAGAQCVDVRMKDFGLEGFEVSDNGSGIQPENYESVALKHYTSKLENFEDLTRVMSFGFRGEALSSLCAVSTMHIVTCTAEQAPVGMKLEFDYHGKLKSSVSTAREKGTTVVIKNIFESLPVRYREFKKNIKKEYGKCVDLIQAYALVCDGVRITFSNQAGKGERVKQFSTSGSATVRDNFANIFGAKALQQVQELEFELLKAVNEVYKTFNMHQFPIVIWNMQLKADMYDVNVTPDKRTLFLHDEKKLFEAIKAELESIFSPSRGVVRSNSDNVTTYSGDGSFDKPDRKASASKREPDMSAVVSEKRRKVEAVEVEARIAKTMSQGTLNEHLVAKKTTVVRDEEVHNCDESEEEQEIVRRSDVSVTYMASSSSAMDVDKSPNLFSDDDDGVNAPAPESTEKRDYISVLKVMAAPRVLVGSPAVDSITPPKSSPGRSKTRSPVVRKPPRPDPAALKPTVIPTIAAARPKKKKGTVDDRFLADVMMDAAVLVPGEAITASYKQYKANQRRARLSKDRSFHSGLGPEGAELAIEEFNKFITKEDFKHMKILGQFNLGFIIARLSGDLFIIDQHASDEKFNYEFFTRNLSITSQPLMRPLTMQLTAPIELIAMDNLDLLRRNGFEIMVDEAAAPGSRIKLASIPQSNTATFGTADLDDILQKLYEGANPNVRCTRVLKMLASKACRKSVMIGDPLDLSQMRKIVCNMAEMDQPWNCPHGRPTMRHLVDLNKILPAK